MSLRQKKEIALAVMLGIPFLMGILSLILPLSSDTENKLYAAAALSVMAGLALHVCWLRCPHCGKDLDRNCGDYCQYCGQEIDWDGKPGKE